MFVLFPIELLVFAQMFCLTVKALCGPRELSANLNVITSRELTANLNVTTSRELSANLNFTTSTELSASLNVTTSRELSANLNVITSAHKIIHKINNNKQIIISAYAGSNTSAK